jgi:hypothetical protein
MAMQKSGFKFLSILILSSVELVELSFLVA